MKMRICCQRRIYVYVYEPFEEYAKQVQIEQERLMINDLQDELCETMAVAYVYEPFEENAKHVEVKPLV